MGAAGAAGGELKTIFVAHDLTLVRLDLDPQGGTNVHVGFACQPQEDVPARAQPLTAVEVVAISRATTRDPSSPGPLTGDANRLLANAI